MDTTNACNKYKFKNRSFLLWGDNAGKTSFILDKDTRLKKMGRVWKIQSSGIHLVDSVKTQLKINKEEIAYATKTEVGEFLWLCINRNESSVFEPTTSKYIKQSGEDDKFIYFNDIIWDEDGSGADLFTFLQAPDFFIEHASNFNCESSKGEIALKIVGGTPPYTVTLNDTESKISNTNYTFSTLTSGEYSITVTEAKGKKEQGIVKIDPFAAIDIALEPVWHIKNSLEITVEPFIRKENKTISFEWIKGERVISSENELTSNQPGEYIFRVRTIEGCVKDIPFRIENSPEDLLSGWQIYPNPVKKGEDFSIAFKLDKESQVSITINSMEGKQILNKNLGTIKDFVFKDNIVTQGVYLITIMIDNTSETVKLIVR